ncbi:MAG: hypothetical protein ACLPSW_16150 [Roseiarcus sp.]
MSTPLAAILGLSRGVAASPTQLAGSAVDPRHCARMISERNFLRKPGDNLMQIHCDRSTGKSTTSDRRDDLLQCRLTIMGLDFDTIERDNSETMEKIERRCLSCRRRVACAMDLKRYPKNLVWEAYCPNSGLLNALVALTEVRAWRLKDPAQRLALSGNSLGFPFVIENGQFTPTRDALADGQGRSELAQ